MCSVASFGTVLLLLLLMRLSEKCIITESIRFVGKPLETKKNLLKN